MRTTPSSISQPASRSSSPKTRGLFALGACLIALGGCGGADQEATSSPSEHAEARDGAQRDKEQRVERARCPRDAANCAAATGSILYVERVDPDGDGDAHFVLMDAGGITASGITVVDVAVHLRPKPLPGPGDTISAAGPVYPGSYGQRQIEAEVVNVGR